MSQLVALPVYVVAVKLDRRNVTPGNTSSLMGAVKLDMTLPMGLRMPPTVPWFGRLCATGLPFACMARDRHAARILMLAIVEMIDVGLPI